MINTIILQTKLFFIRFILQPSFVIKIQNGVATKVAGEVKLSFIMECREIVKRNKLQSGLLYAVKANYGTMVLKASGNISAEVLQQLRNAWGFNM